MDFDAFNTKDEITTKFGQYIIYRLSKLEREGLTQLSRLPYSIRILLESVLRLCNGKEIVQEDVINLAGWLPNPEHRPAMPYSPARVIMQDFTGVPAIVELAAMREAMARMGGDPEKDQSVSTRRPGDRPFCAGRFFRQWGCVGEECRARIPT